MIRMTNLQKYKRVLFSRYGVLAFICLISGPYVVSFFPEVRAGDKFVTWITIGVFLIPAVVFIYGLAQLDAQDYKQRVEEKLAKFLQRHQRGSCLAEEVEDAGY